MVIRHSILDCFGDDYILVKAFCTPGQTPKSGLYLDSLPGINLLNASNINDDLENGKALMKSCIDLAIDQASNDFVAELQKHYNFKSEASHVRTKMSGSHTLYGELAKHVSVKLTKPYDMDSFKKIQVQGFYIYSDRAISKTFYVSTDVDDEISETVSLTKGKNLIPIDVSVDAEYVRISFDISDFKVGRREYYTSFGYHHCKCSGQAYGPIFLEVEESTDSRVTWVPLSDTDTFGFDIQGSLICDNQMLACWYKQELSQAILYKSGINILLEHKATTRINPYVKNSQSEVDYFLELWHTGKTDAKTMTRTTPEYWRRITTAVNSVKPNIPSLESDCFTCGTGSYISDALPG